MPADRPPPLAIRDDAARWNTLRSEKTLAVAARTLVSTIRVLECLPSLLRGDSRVAVVFAYDPTSAFSEGVLDVLHDAGCRVLPWDRLTALAPDLLLSASENIDPPQGDYPVLVLPHGVGFQKFVPDSRSPGTRLSGVVGDRLLKSGRAWLTISHPHQHRQLQESHPEAAERTVLVGDPCFDELRAGLGQAARFRRALGVPDGRRLVVLSSTWGSTSLLGRQPQLPARLLEALPYDEYRVAAILHPHVWSAHGEWQIRTLQAAALEAGLILIPPFREWRSALVAASVVVGDHGSVTLYGAALGKPVVLGAFGGDAVPGTAVAALGRRAPRLRTQDSPERVIEPALTRHDPHRYDDVAALAFAESGQALTRLRALVYDLLGLGEPAAPAAPVLAPAAPESEPLPVTSWVVTTSVARDADPPTVEVRRHPAAVARTEGEGPAGFHHLCCAEDERDTRLTESASVLLCREPGGIPAAAALRWIAGTLSRFPGSLLAAARIRGGGCLVGLRDGRVVEAAPTGPDPGAGPLTALVYTCLRAGLPLGPAVVALRTGADREVDVALRVRPPSSTGGATGAD
ncbi:hypothetical protein [Streptomyces boncukensis]|uniref:Translation initiation factor IF-2 n=1 Tax=Streptomyces boncukensis TaxID=2711219 RepID=A0A6G4WVS4_9ACTN|nr:hypothetical protein [Streptomyces boncukensis]NGO68952.1 hypothetical protein [Streptomyces boncukensis]